MKHKVAGSQHVSRMCLVCGTENRSGLAGAFYELENGELAGVFRPRAEHQGYPGRLHGGISTAMVDETIGRAINVADHEVWGVTVEIDVKFRKPVPFDTEITAVGRITKDSSRLFEGTGEIVLPDGTVAIEAWGKYLKMPIERISDEEAFTEADWGPDERPAPDTIDL